MRRIFHFLFVVAIVGVAGCKAIRTTSHKAPVRTTCVALDNGVVHLEVAPQIGRIVWFGWSDGKNLLWLNDFEKAQATRAKGEWGNYGGDKLWPAQQAKWPLIMPRSWPPDEFIDGSAWTVVEKSERSVSIVSPISKHLGIQVRRDVSLAPNAASVVIRNTITRVEANRFPVQIWTVTQVVPPRFALLDIVDANPGGRLVAELCPGSIALTKIIADDKAAMFKTPTKRSRKIGTLGRWIAGVYDSTIFVEKTRYARFAPYPDKANVELYTEPRYVEMEILSPESNLALNETLTNKVTWTLLKRPKKLDAPKLVNFIEEHK